VKFTQKFAPDEADLSRTLITNMYLNVLEAETLSVFEANEIRKNRYPFVFEGRTFAIDLYLGELFGLVMAETSFATDEQLDSFPRPNFALADVTNNPTFTGGELCRLTFEDIRNVVKRNIHVTQAVSLRAN